MQTRVRNFLVDLDKCLEKGEYRGHSLSDTEEMTALCVANLFVDHGIAPAEVLRALKKAGFGNDPKLLATFRDKDKSNDLFAVLKSL